MRYPPAYVGMPPSDSRFVIDRGKPGGPVWGEIRCGGPCKDNYARIVIERPGGQYVKLQRAALASYLAARSHLGHGILLTGSWRSCALQTSLHDKDPARYADPRTSAHCRGLAVDVSTDQAHLADIHAALVARQWYQARPADEPWHYSFGIEV